MTGLILSSACTLAFSLYVNTMISMLLTQYNGPKRQ